jgi:hypothetical protein
MAYDARRRVTVVVTGLSTNFNQGRRETWELAPSIARGDLNGDCAIDLADFALYAACIAGPGVSTPPPTCTAEQFERADWDQDGDVDLADFPTMQQNISSE